MSDTSLVYDVVADDKATPTLARVSGSVKTAGSAGNAAGMLAKAGMVAATASTVAWGAAVVGSLLPSILLIPGAVEAAVDATTAFHTITGGLGAAWKATGQQVAAGGVSAQQTAERVASAQWQVQTATHGLAAAQRDAKAAQDALNDAYGEAARDLDQLNRDLKSAQDDQAAAAQAVADAKLRLSEAQSFGTTDDITRATIAYNQANDALADSKARTQDLTQQQQKAAAAGVAGSDQVKQAQQQLADAQWQVTVAAHDLADAQQAVKDASTGAAGGVNAADQAMAALAPNARALITELRQVAPAWKAVQQGAQNRAFQDAATDVRVLSSTYLPVARAGLLSMADAFHQTVEQAVGLAQSKQFVADTNTQLTNTATTTRVLGQALVPAVGGLSQLGAVGSQYLPEIAGWVRDLAVDFNAWVTQARQSGQLQQWLSGAVTALHTVWDIGGHVASTIGAIFRAASTAGGGNTLLTTLNQGAAYLDKWANSAAGQQHLAQIFGDLRNLLGSLDQILPTVTGHSHDLTNGFVVAGPVLQFLADHISTVVKLLPFLAAGYLLAKGATTAHYIAEVVKLPILAASAVTQWRLTGAIRAQVPALTENTAALRASAVATEEQTVATDASAISQERGVIATLASRTAALAANVATKAWAAGQWLLNVALDANPVVLITLAIIALIAIIVLIATKTDWFSKGWNAAWGGIKTAAEVVGHWFSTTFLTYFLAPYVLIKNGITDVYSWTTGRLNALVGYVTSLPGRMINAGRGMFDVIRNEFRDAVNWVIYRWNSLSFHIGGQSVFGYQLPSVTISTPDIPYLATGGFTKTAGLVTVGERGAETVALPAGAAVYPHGSTPAGTGGTLRIEVALVPAPGTPDVLAALVKALLPYLRAEVKAKGGTVQNVLGSYRVNVVAA